MKPSILAFLQALFLVCLTSLQIMARPVVDAVTEAFVPDLSSVDQLPVVVLSYDATRFGSKTFIPATFTLYEADSTRTYSCQVRQRGATSLMYDKPNFAVKFVDDQGASTDVRLAGMRKDNYWILDAMASDFGKVRNRVSMDLWLDFSRPTYHQASEPKAINGYRGRYVEVYVNEAYYGLFCLMERVDRKQLQLRKFKKEHDEFDADSVPIHIEAYHRGLLYKAVNGNSTRTPYLLYQTSDPDDSRSKYDGMQGEYPDVTDGEPWTWEPLRTNIYFMAAKTSNTFNQGVGKYFDVPVFIDYVLFLDLLYANDNVGKNVLYWFYDQSSDDQRISVTPWDLDTSWGRDYMGSRVSPDKELENKSNFHTRFTKWYRHYDDTLSVRYGELRDSLWREDRLTARFNRYFDLFRSTGAWQREVDRWSTSNCKLRDIDDEQQYIVQWIQQRLAYLDTVYGYQPPSAISSPSVDASSAADCYDLFGRPVSADHRRSSRILLQGRSARFIL